MEKETKVYNSLKEIEDDETFIIDDVIQFYKNKRLLKISNRKFHIHFDFHLNVNKLISILLKRVGHDKKDLVDEIIFNGIKFKNIMSFVYNVFDYSLIFENCLLDELSQTNIVNKTKVSFRDNCNINKILLTNVTFLKLFEIYNSTVCNSSIFNKVNFNDNAVFTKTEFCSNLCFPYTTFEKLGIFSRATFKNCKGKPTGLDLSQSIINGNLVFFETQLGNFKASRIESISPEFDKAIDNGEKIPYQNKRETFRIIKQQLIEQNNLIVAEKYAKLEKQTYMCEIFNTINFRKVPSLFTLFINLISNYFKTSWLVAFAFIFGSAFVFDLWLENVSTVYLYTDNTLIKLINPTDFSFYEKFENNGYAYRIYLAGKIVVGFGIYQLIQAFRKFK